MSKPGWQMTAAEKVAQRHRPDRDGEAETRRMRTAHLIAASLGEPQPITGELPGVRDTRNDMVSQEIAMGASPEAARRQVDRVVAHYERSVKAGHEPYPAKR